MADFDVVREKIQRLRLRIQPANNRRKDRNKNPGWVLPFIVRHHEHWAFVRAGDPRPRQVEVW